MVFLLFNGYKHFTFVYRMCAQVAPSGECLRDKGKPDRIVGKTWCRLFLAAYIPVRYTWLLLSCVTACRAIAAWYGRLYMLHIICKVERLVLTTLNEDYYYYYFYF